jgi:hypothetical protein
MADAVARGAAGHPDDEDPARPAVTSLVQRQPEEPGEPDDEEEDREEEVQELRARRNGSRVAPEVPPWFGRRLRQAEAGGEPLAPDVRGSMESAFGATFAEVRTHGDAGAAELSRAIGAAAFTHGKHIFLGPARLDPHSREGRRLLAHELTHVVQQNPHVAGRHESAAAVPALQRDDKPAQDEPPGPEPKRQVEVYFFGPDDKPFGSLPYAETMFASLEPGVYDCVVTADTITAEGKSERYHAQEIKPGGWKEFLHRTKRAVLVISEPGAKTAEGEEQKPPTGTGTAGEEGEEGKSGSKYGWLGLIHLPKSVTRALDWVIEALRLDDDITQIKALLKALKDLWDHRSELGALFTMEKLLGVLFGIENGSVDALEKWVNRRARAAHAAGGEGKKGIAEVAASLARMLEVVRNILRPVFRVRKVFSAVTSAAAGILEKVPLLEDLLEAGSAQGRTSDFDSVLGEVVDDISEHIKSALGAVRGRVDLVAESLAEKDYVTYQQLARAIAAVAEKLLPKTARAFTWVASKLGVDVPEKIADHIIAPLIPKSALDEINGAVRGVLSGLEPLIKGVKEAIDEIIAGIEAEVHDVLAPELTTLFAPAPGGALAQPSRLDGSTARGFATVDHVQPELAASQGQPLTTDLRAEFANRLGVDFADVRVHDDRHSADAAEALDAKAFTVGRDVFFGPGRYAPSTSEGRRLLAHELTHVIQQAQGDSVRTVRRSPKNDVKQKLGRSFVKSIVDAARGLVHISPDVAKRGAEIKKYVKSKLLHKPAGRALPPDAYYYVYDKRNVPVNIRRKLRFVPVVPKLRIVKGKIEEGLLSSLDPVARWKKSERAKLRRVLGCGADEQAHHVIPLELAGPLGVSGHPVVAEAVSQGFAFSGAENGICLHEDVHEGPHAGETELMRQRLDAIRGMKGSSADRLKEVRRIVAQRKQQLATRKKALP